LESCNNQNQSNELINPAIQIDNHDQWEDPIFNNNNVYSVDIDSNGNYWVTGAVGLGDSILGPLADVYISKLNPNFEIEFIKFFRGSLWEVGNSIAVDSQDNVILATQTESADLPVVGGQGPSSERSRNTNSDFYVAKMDTNGEILWSTYIGGHWFDCCSNVFVDEEDSIYLFGHVNAESPFLELKDPWTIGLGSMELLIAKFLPDGELEWSTVFGGDGQDYFGVPYYIGNGHVLLSGWSESLDYEFVGKNLTNGDEEELDVAIIEMNVTSQEILWSTQYGASSEDASFSRPEYDDDFILISGETDSIDFPVVNPFDLYEGEYSFNEGFVTLINQSRDVVWSSYIGGSADDWVFGSYFLGDDDIVIIGGTMSYDFPVTDSSIFHNDSMDIFITKVDRDGGVIKQSTLFGGDNFEGSSMVYVENFGNTYLVAGNTLSTSWETNENAVSSVYPFSFGGNSLGFIYQYDPVNLNPILFTHTTVVPDPDRDYDGDGLTNLDEYTLYFEGKEVDPLNPDSDGDGLPDGWEVEFGLDVDDLVESSADSDTFDDDGLTNLQEYQFGTWPNKTDTDADGMPDDYEYIHGLNGSKFDADEDKDNDTILNLAEYQYGLSASSSIDGNEDKDGDGAGNAYEYEHGTNLTLRDTDGDGIDDGYELQHGMDPLKNDLGDDSDGDFLKNEFEYKYNLNPGNPIEGIIVLAFLGSVIATFILIKYRSRRRNKKAKKEGFESYSHKKSITEAGYSNEKEYEEAKELGFLSKQVQVLVNSLEYHSVGQFVSGIDHFTKRVDTTYNQSLLESKLDLIKEIKTPIQLIEIKNALTEFREGISSSIQRSTQIIDTQISINQSMEISKKDQSMHDLSPESISQSTDQLKTLRIRLQEYQNLIDKAIAQREQWLVPWAGMLKLIQITEDKAPIPISDIMEVVNITEEHAIEMISILLQENSEFGTYDPETKIYKKSTQAMISAYMEKALQIMYSLEEE
jgi:hypothetical protein